MDSAGGVGLACAVIGGLASASVAAPPPLFGDWWYLMPEGWRDVQSSQWDAADCASVRDFSYDSASQYTPVNQPGGGHGGPTYERGTWMADYAICLAHHLAASGAKVAREQA